MPEDISESRKIDEFRSLNTFCIQLKRNVTNVPGIFRSTIFII